MTHKETNLSPLEQRDLLDEILGQLGADLEAFQDDGYSEEDMAFLRIVADEMSAPVLRRIADLVAKGY